MYPIKKLGEIAKIYAGSSAPQEDKYFEKGIFPFVRTSDLGRYGKTKNLIIVSDYINDLCIKEKTLTFAKKGTIIFPKSGASILSNHRGILGIDAYFVSHLAGIDSGNEITNNYLYNFLLQLDLVDYCDNPAYPSLQLSKIKEIPIPLPPLPTQKLIVQKLDSAFENINKNIDLTKENLKNLEELNKSVLEKVFSEGEYEMKILGEICDYMGSGFACNKSNEVIGGYTHLRTHNIGTDGKLNFDLFIDINIEKVDLNKSKIYKGDILFNNTNSKELVGKTAYVDKDYNYGYSNHLTRLVINRNHNSNYISLYLNFLFKKGYFENICNKWIGQAGVNNGMLKQIQIPLPQLQKQKEIVSYLDQVFEKNKQLKTKYELQLKELEELKQSLLKDAFEGRLVKE